MLLKKVIQEIPDTHINQYLTFFLDQEMYAINIIYVQEIQSYDTFSNIQKILDTPSHIEGIIHFHDTIIPIIDLRKFYKLEPIVNSKYRVIVILKYLNKLFGILVDLASDIVEISVDKIEPAPDLFILISRDYIQGIVKYDDHLIAVIDIEKFIFNEQLQLAKQLINDK